PLAGTTGTATLPGFAVYGIEEDIRTPYVHQITASLEREILPNTVASVQYSGGLGRDLYTVYNVNRPGSAAYLNVPTTFQRLNPNFGPVYFLTSDGRSNYNAVIVEVMNSTWRSIGLQMSARYRYSRGLDNTPSFNGFGMNSLSANLLDPFNPNNDYGTSDFNIRHRFIGTFNWEVPFERLTGDFAKQIFGGWEVTGIVQARSGMPFTVFNCSGATSAEQPCPRVAVNGGVDRMNTGDLSAVSGIPNRFVYTNFGGQIIDSPSAFPPFTAGTMSRNYFEGPRFWNVDLGVHKRFQITEGTSVQLRGEFYNAFNHANNFIRANEVDVSSTSFVPAYRSGRRHIQLAVKFLF
ncbi:MAG TPA: hypothetical protein VEF04_04360, partial [Blastocatellia bacterium]|nr:hypothetical protein [Blastocatellia bacterium]